MFSLSHLGLSLAAAVVVAYLVLSLREWRRRRGPSRTYPPRPPRLPIIGNLLDLPTEAPWIKYTEWAQRYGDIVSVSVADTIIVVLTSVQAASEVLGKRGANFIDRPAIPFLELINWSFFISAAPYSDSWRIRRKHSIRGLRPRALQQYEATQREKVHHFLKDLYAQPAAFRSHFEFLDCAIIMSVLYGYNVGGNDDEFLTVARDANTIGQSYFLPKDTPRQCIPIP
ncbi:cytochrome P450 [Auriscalpium vulgare]|uniref:Cytochrome P450 n=1 Tax=Auriscalpium vulgare TaxID=40419 RepID=A0ACB8RPD7_9AGAM|nr:cytochrome P450 [Auriscalpium vulgare]